VDTNSVFRISHFSFTNLALKKLIWDKKSKLKMPSAGKAAFIVILILGAVTGITSYYLFAQVSPVPGIMKSLSRNDLPREGTPAAVASNTKSNNSSAGRSGTINTVSGPVGATIIVLQGASIQGNPAYDPSAVKVKKGSVIQVTNKDSVPHTVTNGKGADDPNTGKLFDTSIINSGESAKIDTSKLSVGRNIHSIVPYILI
jgi:plastocyanin